MHENFKQVEDRIFPFEYISHAPSCSAEYTLGSFTWLRSSPVHSYLTLCSIYSIFRI